MFTFARASSATFKRPGPAPTAPQPAPKSRSSAGLGGRDFVLRTASSSTQHEAAISTPEEAEASEIDEERDGTAIAAGVAGQSGAPLPDPVRNHFELRFGWDFNAVRVHAGSEAAHAARAVAARAYTLGNHIVFGADEYAPSTQPGMRLLAHELAHVVQQSSPGAPKQIARTPENGCTEDAVIEAGRTDALSRVDEAIQLLEHVVGGTASADEVGRVRTSLPPNRDVEFLQTLRDMRAALAVMEYRCRTSPRACPTRFVIRIDRRLGVLICRADIPRDDLVISTKFFDAAVLTARPGFALPHREVVYLGRLLYLSDQPQTPPQPQTQTQPETQPQPQTQPPTQPQPQPQPPTQPQPQPQPPTQPQPQPPSQPPTVRVTQLREDMTATGRYVTINDAWNPTRWLALTSTGPFLGPIMEVMHFHAGRAVIWTSEGGRPATARVVLGESIDVVAIGQKRYRVMPDGTCVPMLP